MCIINYHYRWNGCLDLKSGLYVEKNFTWTMYSSIGLNQCVYKLRIQAEEQQAWKAWKKHKQNYRKLVNFF